MPQPKTTIDSQVVSLPLVVLIKPSLMTNARNWAPRGVTQVRAHTNSGMPQISSHFSCKAPSRMNARVGRSVLKSFGLNFQSFSTQRGSVYSPNLVSLHLLSVFGQPICPTCEERWFRGVIAFFFHPSRPIRQMDHSSLLSTHSFPSLRDCRAPCG